MRRILLWAGAEMRARKLATVAIAVVAGVAGGSVLAAVAGARRTESAVERFVAFSRPGHASLGIDSEEGAGADYRAIAPVYDRVADLEDIEATDRGTYWVLVVADARGRPDMNALGTVNPFGAYPGSTGEPMNRLLIIDGRAAAPSRPHEVVISQVLADRRGLHPGDTLHMAAYAVSQLAELESFGEGPPIPAGPRLRLDIVGVGRLPMDLGADLGDQDAVAFGTENVYLTPAFATRYDGKVANFGVGLEVRLRGGRDGADDLRRAVERESVGGLPVYVDTGSQQTETAAKVDRAVGLQAAALYLFAALAALIGGFVLVQALSRQLRSEAVARGVARSLGMTSRDLGAAAAVRGAACGVLAAVIAIGVAVAASPLLPFGLARDAEVDAGVHADLPVLVAGAGALVLLFVVAALAVGHRSASAAADGAGRHRTARAGALPGVGRSAVATAGVQMALDPGRGQGAVPVRSALAGTLVAVAGLVAAVVFAASMSRLLDRPVEQGWNWDVAVGEFGDEGRSQYQEAVAPLRANPTVDEFSAYLQSGVEVDGHAIPVAAVEPMQGTALPRVLHGRQPRAPDEVALGRATMQTLRLSLGSTLRLDDDEGGPAPSYRVVGESLFPAGLFNLPGIDGTLGDGIVMSIKGLERLRPDIREEVAGFLVRFRPGVDERDGYASLRADFGRTVIRSMAPTDVANLRRVAGLPNALAALLVFLAIAALAHALATSVRRRRRDLALLKTLGLRRRQLSAVVAWQATTVAVLALVVAVPVGVAVGRWAWQLVADRVWAASPAVVPAWVALVVPAVVVAANAVAAVPGWLAARVRPAVVLRSE